jgi:hypothetical protein
MRKHGRVSILVLGLGLTSPVLWAQCSPDAVSGLTVSADLAVCAGNWTGTIDPGGNTLCDVQNGWGVCQWNSPQLKALDAETSIAFPGCYAYNASQDEEQCNPCTGLNLQDDLAGIGDGCWDWTTFFGRVGGCLGPSSHRLDASCCADYFDPATACTQHPLQQPTCCGAPSPLPVIIDGVACCCDASDADGDGIAGCSGDACPGTSPGAVVDPHGCSIDQLCADANASHGACVGCHSREAKRFAELGLITRQEAQAITRDAAKRGVEPCP